VTSTTSLSTGTGDEGMVAGNGYAGVASTHPRERTTRRPMRWLIAIVYFTIIFQGTKLPYNTGPADFFIAAVLFIGLVWMCRQGSVATALFRKTMPWLWLILLGSLLGLFGVGLPFWAFSSLARLVAAIFSFFAFMHLFVTRPRLIKPAIIGTWAGWGLTIFWLVVVEGFGNMRPDAFFSHPNYPGHYLVTAACILFAYYRSFKVRAFVIGATALGVFATASFGAMAMGLALVAVGLYRVVGRQVAALAIVVVSSLILIVLLFGVSVQVEADESTLDVNRTLNAKRFERSRDGRLQLWSEGIDAWTDSPFGVGPDGVKNRRIGVRGGEPGSGGSFEIHADALGYLVERGIIGLVGYVGLWVTLWRSDSKRGIGRALITALVVAGLFRETIHYRHAWLMLAIAFSLDYLRQNEDGEDEPSALATPAA
jgi:O-antigen ligase